MLLAVMGIFLYYLVTTEGRRLKECLFVRVLGHSDEVLAYGPCY